MENYLNYSNITSQIAKMDAIREDMKKEGVTEKDEEELKEYVDDLRIGYQTQSNNFKKIISEASERGVKSYDINPNLIDNHILNSDQNIIAATKLRYELNNKGFFESNLDGFTKFLSETGEKIKGPLTSSNKGDVLAKAHKELSDEVFKEYKDKVPGLTLETTSALMTEFLASGLEVIEWIGFYLYDNSLTEVYNGKRFQKYTKLLLDKEKHLSWVYNKYLNPYLKERNQLYTVRFEKDDKQAEFFGQLKNGLSTQTDGLFEDELEVLNGLYTEKEGKLRPDVVLGVVPALSDNSTTYFVVDAKVLQVPTTMIPEKMRTKISSLKQNMNIQNTYQYSTSKDNAVNLYVGALGVKEVQVS